MIDRARDFKADHAGVDPSLPSTAPKTPFEASTENFTQKEGKKGIAEFFYNREKQEYCGRTCKSWICIIAYAIFYLIFLTTFTLILLYLSLVMIKKTVVFEPFEPTASMLFYPETGIELTAIPTSEFSYPLIWYKNGESADFQKYVIAIDNALINNRKVRDISNLGTCAQYPYGYGEKPCIFIKVNKRFYWSEKPLQLNSSLTKVAPPEVLKWMQKDSNKLWLRCSGYHSYDREHIGTIKYFPDPPGLDPELFPKDGKGKPPVVAIQLSNFTVGISLAIECKLWYDKGPATVEFVLYVAPSDRTVFFERTSPNL